MKYLYFILFIFSFSRVLVSQVCDKAAIQKKIARLENKNRRDKSEQMAYADAYFELAECNETQGDTISRSNYVKAIKVYKDLYTHDPTSENKLKATFKIGLSYFKLEDYANALTYFSKVECVGKNINTEAAYYVGACFIYLKKYPEAKVELEMYNRLTSDTARTMKFIKLCINNSQENK